MTDGSSTPEPEHQGQPEKNPGILADVWYYVTTYRRWWLIPMIVVLVLFGILVVVAEVAPIASPFIYTLF